MPKTSQQSYCYRRTGLGVGEGVVVAGEVVAAGRSYGLELMVRKCVSKVLPGRGQCVEELIVRIIHLVHFEHFLQTPLVERAIMRH